MSESLVTPELRRKLAMSCAAIVSESATIGRIDAEVGAVLDEHPTLPRTEAVRRVLWALIFLNLFETASAAPAQPQATKAA